jgi:hypothetical protein
VKPLPDIVSEADRILVAAHVTQAPLRLIGGLAINRQIGDELHEAPRRPFRGIDLAIPKGHGCDVARNGDIVDALDHRVRSGSSTVFDNGMSMPSVFI